MTRVIGVMTEARVLFVGLICVLGTHWAEVASRPLLALAPVILIVLHTLLEQRSPLYLDKWRTDRFTEPLAGYVLLSMFLLSLYFFEMSVLHLCLFYSAMYLCYYELLAAHWPAFRAPIVLAFLACAHFTSPPPFSPRQLAAPILPFSILMPLLTHSHVATSFSYAEAFILTGGLSLFSVHFAFPLFQTAYYSALTPSEMSTVIISSLTLLALLLPIAVVVKFTQRSHKMHFYLLLSAIFFSFVGLPALLDIDGVFSWAFHLVFRFNAIHLTLYWVVLLAAFGGSLYHFSFVLIRLSRTMLRKYFHLLAVLIFIPGVIYNFRWLRFCVALVLIAFLVLEFVRYCEIDPLARLIDEFIQPFLDVKDRGPLVLTHVYLLFGCAFPILFTTSKNIFIRSSGILFLGIADSAASIVGTSFGSTWWLPTSKKSVEGSVAALISMVASVYLSDGITVARLMAILLTSALEGVTSHIDNLVVPLFLTSLLLAFPS